MSAANIQASLTVTGQIASALAALQQLKKEAEGLQASLAAGEKSLGELRKTRTADEIAGIKTTAKLSEEQVAYSKQAAKDLSAMKKDDAAGERQVDRARASEKLAATKSIARDQKNATANKIKDDAFVAKQVSEGLKAEARQVEANARSAITQKNRVAAEEERLAKRASNRASQDAFYKVTRDPANTTSTALNTALTQNRKNWTASQVSAVEEMLKSKGFANAWKEAGSRAASDFMKVFAVGAVAGFAAFKFGEEIFKASSKLETLRLQMKGIYKDDELAAKQYGEYMRIAKAYGTDPVAVAPGYLKLAAGARGAGLQPEEINSMTTSIMKARAAFNLSSQDTYLTMRELSNILSTNKVQARELNSIGFHLPDLQGIIQRATGVDAEKFAEYMKKGQVDAKKFVQALLLQVDIDVSKGAAEAQKSAQEAVNRLHTQSIMALDAIGQGGFNQALNKVATDMMKTLETPAAAANLKAIGSAMGEMVLWLYQAVKNTIQWVKDNEENIKSWSKWALIAVEFIAGFKLVALAIGGVIGAAGVLKVGLIAINALLEFTMVGGAAKFATSAVTGLQAVGFAGTTLVGVLGSVIGRLLVMAGIAASIYAIMKIAEARGKYKDAEKVYQTAQGDLSKSTPEELEAMRATMLEKKDSDENTVNRWIQANPKKMAVARLIPGVVGSLAGVAESLSSNEQDKQIDETVATLDKAIVGSKARAAKTVSDETAAEAKRLADMNAKLAAVQESGIFGAAKEKKGGGTGDGSNHLASSEIANSKAAYEAEKEALKLKLDENEIAYGAYYDRLASLREEETKRDIAALEGKRANASKNAKTSAKELQAIDNEINTAREKEAKDLDALKIARMKATKAYEKETAKEAAEYEAIMDDSTFARKEQIEAKYVEKMKEASANGDTERMTKMRQLIDLEKARLDITKEQNDISRQSQKDALAIGGIELEHLKGRATTLETEQKIWESKKAQNLVELASLEAMKAEAVLNKVREEDYLKLDAQILELKKKLEDMSPVAKAISDAISGGFEKGFLDLMNQKGGLKGLIKGVLDSVLGVMKNIVAKNMAEGMMEAIDMKGTASGGKGSGMGVLGGLINAGIGYFTGGSASGGIMSSLAGAFSSSNPMGALAGTMGAVTDGSYNADYGNEGRSSAMQASSANTNWLGASSNLTANTASAGVGQTSQSSGHTVVMNVMTPDANSFRLGRTQISMDMSLAAQRASARNG